MQQHVCYRDALLPHGVQQLGRKVQSGSRCCGRTALMCIDGLIPFLIVKLLRDIRRQRNLSRAIQHLFKNAVIVQIDQAAAFRVRLSLDRDPKLVVYNIPMRRFCAPCRTCKRLPAIALHAFQEKKLHVPARILSLCKQARRDDAGRISHEHIARLQMFQNIREHAVGDRFRLSVVDQQPRGRAILRRGLRDQLMRQIIIKIAGLHSVSASLSISIPEYYRVVRKKVQEDAAFL